MNPIRANSSVTNDLDKDTNDSSNSARVELTAPKRRSEQTVTYQDSSYQDAASQDAASQDDAQQAHVDFAGARAYALARLEAELPPQFGYHSLEHTRDNVYPTALRIATLEGVSDHDLLLVKTAAFYHDLGFTAPPYNSLDHEVRGAHIAATILPDYGYDEASIHTIQGMIQATKLPQQPHNLLENIMADADLSVLGQLDFLVQNKALRAELESSGLDTDNQRWLTGQYHFLTQHRYYTTAAKQLLCAQKAVNLAALRTLLTDLDAPPT
ncbi:MAG: HD domain-containing protein [Deinococcota bacterium]